MRGPSLCEVLQRGSPKTGFLVLLSLISGMLISYLACLSHIWHAYLISGMFIWHALSGMLIWHVFVNLARSFNSFKFSSFLYGPQERAEHPSQLLPYPLGGGRLPRVPQLYFSTVLFGGDVLYLHQLYFLTSSSTAWFSTTPSTLGHLCSSPSWVKNGGFLIIITGYRGFYIIREFRDFDDFCQWGKVKESGCYRQVFL